jgi:hypothetical protein
MIEYPPYPCLGSEAAGDAVLTDSEGEYVNTIHASRCFLEWYCPPNGYAWAWRDGIDPDDPTTWPDYVPPEDPAPEQ